MAKKWLKIILIILALWLLSNLFSNMINNDFNDKIAIIPIKGMIISDGDGFVASTTSSFEIAKQLDELKNDNSVKAVILEIDSGGGTVFASKEIVDAVKSVKQTKPVVAVIREIGASGSYWVASASNLIIADPLSITGSIGVLGSYLQFSRLFEKYGVTYERIVAGKYKDMHSPYKNLTAEEKEKLQETVNEVYEYMIQDIANNRNMSVKKVEELATGEVFLGKDALKLNLIDYTGNMQLAVNLTKDLAHAPDAVTKRYEHKKSLKDVLSELTSNFANKLTLNTFNVMNEKKLFA